MPISSNLIGRYVHFHYSNYKQQELGGAENLAFTIADQKRQEGEKYVLEQYLRLSKYGKKAEIQKRLNLIFGHDGNFSYDENTTWPLIENFIFNVLQTRVDNAFSKADVVIDRNNLLAFNTTWGDSVFTRKQRNVVQDNMDLQSIVNSISNESNKRIYQLKNSDSKVSGNVLIRDINILLNNINSFARIIESDPNGNALRVLDAIYMEILELIKRANSQSRYSEDMRKINALLGGSDKNFFVNRSSLGRIEGTGTKYDGLDLASAIRLLKRDLSSQFYGAATEIVSEGFVSAALVAMEHKANNFIQSGVVGPIREAIYSAGAPGVSKTITLASNFSKSAGISDDIINGKIDTKDLVDYTVTVDGLTFNISQKVHNFSKNRALTVRGRGSNILALIQEDAYFVNHYLNIVSTHTAQKEQPSSTLLQGMKKAFSLMVLLKSMMGGVLKINSQTGTVAQNEEAEYMIVIDNSQVPAIPHVYSFYEIMNEVIKDIEKYVTITGIPSLWPNDFEPSKYGFNQSSANIRIQKMLTAMIQTKYSVSIDKDVLKI